MSDAAMATAQPQAERGRSSLGGVIAVAMLQIVVFIATAVVWLWTHFAAEGRCDDASCDVGQAAQANALFLGGGAFSFAVTIIAAVVSDRTGRDLAWVPAVGCALIVIAYFPAAALFNAAAGA